MSIRVVPSLVGILGIILAADTTAPSSSVQPRQISFESRVSAQKAIEQVYWNHRIWPKENPGPKPPLSAVMPDSAIRWKVEDYLEKSNALERIWRRPVTAEQLQAEMDRMVANTHDGGLLNELFAALGNDPVLIADTFVRESLVKRLIHNWYANDERIHADTKRMAKTARASCENVGCLKAMAPAYTEIEWARSTGVSAPGKRGEDERAVLLDTEQWNEQIDRLAKSVGSEAGALPIKKLGRLEETTDAFVVRAVLEQRGDRIKTATATWPKRSIDAWWEEQRTNFNLEIAPLTGTIVLRSPAPTCAPDRWVPTHRDLPTARYFHSAVWTGAEMLVWGGSEAGTSKSGDRYNPATDSWLAMASGPNAPSARFRQTAVWTGTEMIVWGGDHVDSYSNVAYSFNTGGRYNPSTDSWVTTSLGTNVPDPRSRHTAIWTGSEMIVWGGYSADDAPLNSGGRYNPSSDSWTATSTGIGVPDARFSHTAVWTGNEMIVWGGAATSSEVNSGGRYDPVTDSWRGTDSGIAAPSPRESHTAIWTGSEMIVWGGESYDGSYHILNTGGRYNPVADTWIATSTGTGVPDPLAWYTVVWTGSEMIVWGGQVGSGTRVNSGARYNPVGNNWIATSTGANTPGPRTVHTAVWTGSEMIVWGGTSNSSVLNTGGRYNPSTDSWVATAIDTHAPVERYGHTAIWTGAEMIVWGGESLEGSSLNTGDRYDPATDSWVSTSTGLNAPPGRFGRTAVWTGTEMIVWGGYLSNGHDLATNTGGRYNPATDSWIQTSAPFGSVPGARRYHSAVWSGSEMLIWGGDTGYPSNLLLNSGARYNPSDDYWFATSTGPNVPSARGGHAAVWTGSVMIVWGGASNGSYLSTGGRFDPVTDSWSTTSMGTGTPDARVYHTAVWTGNEMIVWGGYHYDGANYGYTNSGGRYAPSGDSWTATSTGMDVPDARAGHTAVWTGREMIVWGGEGSNSFLNSGGRYLPSDDSWTATTMGDKVPDARFEHTAVWTGREMIVWGGRVGGTIWNTGGRLCATVCTSPEAFFEDSDFDGYGNPNVSVVACPPPPGYVPNGLDCDDANPAVHPGAIELCNGTDDNCDGIVDEGGGSLCADGNVCTDDVCHGVSGCAHTPNAASCNDGNACTTGDFCAGGHCQGTAITCDDAIPCTVDNCNPALGCVHTASDVLCDDSNPCTDDSCDPAIGCLHVPNPDVSCDDGNACTMPDMCVNGVCIGAPFTCNDFNPCTDDSCDAGIGCVFLNNALACDDGNPCTTGDVCSGGVCRGTTTMTPPPEVQGVTVSTDKVTFHWSAATYATQYDVVRGSTGAFPVGPGGADEVCFDNLTGTAVGDTTVPIPGAGFWYLARGQNACGSGTFGTRSGGAPRVTTSCP